MNLVDIFFLKDFCDEFLFVIISALFLTIGKYCCADCFVEKEAMSLLFLVVVPHPTCPHNCLPLLSLIKHPYNTLLL